MKIEKVTNEGNVVFTPYGRLDSTTAGEFEAELDNEINDSLKTLTIDLGNVDFVSSKGLRVLVSAYKKLCGREIILNNVNSSIYEVLKLSGLLKIFTINEKTQA